jgi:hypothetical protein
MSAACACAAAISSAGSGLAKRSSTLAAFTFTRLPESSSTCTEASASDITRPARNLPASSNRANIEMESREGGSVIVPLRQATACDPGISSRSGPAGRTPGRGFQAWGHGQAQPAQHRGQMGGEVAQGVVVARQHGELGAQVVGHHFAPVEHLVALGDQHVVTLWPGDGVGVQFLELGDEFGTEEKVIRGVVKARLLADVARQIARGGHGGVDQQGAAIERLGQHGGVKAPQRRADDHHPLARPVEHEGLQLGDGLGRRGRQLRAQPGQLMPLLLKLGDGGPELSRLGRLR